MLSETRTPRPCAPGQVMRYDYAYIREDVGALFMLLDPIRAGLGEIVMRSQHTAVDWWFTMADARMKLLHLYPSSDRWRRTSAVSGKSP
ncbi:MAG: hypothetical protein AAGI71_12595 [Bacteroidota bacterium]